MTNIRFFFILFFVVSAYPLSAQNMVVHSDPKIEKLVEEHKKANLKVGLIEGYRIQIFFDSGANSRLNAESTKQKFSAKYPEVPVYLTYKEPNFRVRVGDFRNRAEARGFYHKIFNEYPNSFVIKDEIKLPSLQTSESSN